jgi:ADP-heptose:LPS heptosyltransferase
MKIILALHSSGETQQGTAFLWRSYPREMELYALLQGHEVEIVGSADRNTWTKTFEQLTAKIDNADIIIVTDNGILALALALGKSVVAIFGPTDEESIVRQFGRFQSQSNVRIIRSEKSDAQCQRPCNFQAERGFEVKGKCAKGKADCITEIEPEEIFNAVLTLIK